MECKTEKEKGRGRPPKYSSEYLINIVKLYIKTTGKTIKVKPTPVAEFGAKTLKIKGMYYQHFTRNTEVMEFIENWNADVDKMLLGSKRKDNSIIHSTIDIDRFLQNNKSEEKTRKLLAQFNDNMSRMTDQYTKLEKKFNKQVELNLKLENKLKETLEKLNAIEKENFEKNKKEKQKRIKVQKLNDTLRKKVYIYEAFIKEYHTDVIAQQALALENNLKDLSSEVVQKYVFANKDKYASGEYDLSAIIESYNKLLAGVNKLNTPIDEDDQEYMFDSDLEDETLDEDIYMHLLAKYNIELCEDDEDDEVFAYDEVDISIEEDDEW